MNEPPQDSLVECAQAGDRRALEELLVQQLPSVEAFVRLRTGAALLAREQVEDIVQSVCREALGALSGFEFRGARAFRHWLCQQALHKVADKGRFYKQQRRDVGREVAADGDDGQRLSQIYATMCTPSRVMQGKESNAALEAAFAQLPDDYREAITLTRIVGLPYEDVAEAMGRSLGATRNLVYRGIARLDRLLGERLDHT
ncbi:MAG: sigma-70 family RNA polymerase sigma factor [Planctomycetota bacterium]